MGCFLFRGFQNMRSMRRRALSGMLVTALVFSAAAPALAQAAENALGKILSVLPAEHRAAAELERALDTLGLGGLFLHPHEELFRINGPLVRPLMAVARRRAR